MIPQNNPRNFFPVKTEREEKQKCDNTMVGDYRNIMKTTFDLNFELYQAFKQHEYTKTWKQRKAVN